jgi:hypothetical protein
VTRTRWLAVLAALGCPTQTDADATPSRSDDALAQRCTAAIEHTTLGIYPEAAQPKGAERGVIVQLNAAAIEVCTREGLTEAQAACFATGSMDDALASVRTCLGDARTWPSWFSGGGVQVPEPARSAVTSASDRGRRRRPWG